MHELFEETDIWFSRGGGGGGGGAIVDANDDISFAISSRTSGGGAWISTTSVTSLDFDFWSSLMDDVFSLMLDLNVTLLLPIDVVSSLDSSAIQLILTIYY